MNRYTLKLHQNESKHQNQTLINMENILIICITMLLSTTTAFADSEFNGFPDVQESDWYYEDVKTSLELGIIKGYPDGTFKANENITIAEVITMAVKVFKTYSNGNNFVGTVANSEGQYWYSSEINYAIENGLIIENEFSNYEKTATKGEMAYIFSKALSENQYQPINNIVKLPDVDSSNEYGLSILKLYNAGILCGNDIYGTFNPNTAITRAEAAAVINSTILPEKRKSFTLQARIEIPESYLLNVTDIPQYGELPGGCEITSLAIALNYMGFNVDKCYLSDNFLPQQNVYTENGVRYGPDPYVAYPGNPRNSSGWYCWAPPIVQAANSYLTQNNSTFKAVDLTGITQVGIEEQIRSGHPVVVWVTLNFGNLTNFGSTYWYTPNGVKIVPYTTIHCLVVTGYDENTFKISDPLQKTSSISKDKFMPVFQTVGSYAMAIY